MVERKYKNVLVTGAAGFIGYHLSKRLLEEGFQVIGVDNLNSYYDVNLKKSRLEILEKSEGFTFVRLDISELKGLEGLFQNREVDLVVNLAAQAGVRYSLEDPHTYVESNVVGFVNLLECCRLYNVKHLLFASSSSVYGANRQMPFSVRHNVDHPVSLYAATKKSNELMAHVYAHLYQLPCTGLRFFTVYGPWGRPDMAYFLFTKAILEGRPIKVFNHGRMKRDFTYIDDIVEGVIRVMERPPMPNLLWDRDIKSPDPGSSWAGYRIYNIGNNRPVELIKFIETIESILGIKAKKEFCDMQPGDVTATYADIDDLMEDVGFRPEVELETGIERFVSWYRTYYKVGINS